MPNPSYALLMTQEYQSLREELRDSRRFIFERPLVTILAILAAAKLGNEQSLFIMSIIAIFLLPFNLWFTATRLKNATRIVAYIQVFLENGNNKDWIGWENYLRYQRIIQNTKKELSRETRKKELAQFINEEAIPKYLFF